MDMCWAGRKKQGGSEVDNLDFSEGLPRDHYQDKLTLRIGHYERRMKETEDELQLVQRALRERERALKTLPAHHHHHHDNNDHDKPKQKDASSSGSSSVSSSQSDSVSDSDDDQPINVDYLAMPTKKYLMLRPQGPEYTQFTSSVLKELKELLTNGINIIHVTKEKKGAFGRKKGSKRVKCVMQMGISGRERYIKYGPSLNSLKTTVYLESISKVTYGYESDLFAPLKDSLKREEIWTCITIYESGNQHDFVITDDSANMAVMCVLSPSRRKMTVGKWRWIRSFMKFQLNESNLMIALNKLARAEDVDQSDASSVASK